MALGSGMNDWVYALAVSGSELYAAGDFTTAGGKISGYVAKAVINPPFLTVKPDDGGYILRFSGVPGSDYRLQRAASVTGPWSDLATNTAPASGLIEYHETTPPPGKSFYRSVHP